MITLIIAALGIAGTIGGVLAGHFLTRSWQRRLWLQDRRNEEFRELIAILVECFVKYGDVKYVLKIQNEEDVLEKSKISARCYQALYDRIYIAKDVLRLGLVNQWAEAVESLDASNDPAKFGGALKRMTREIVDAATHGL